MSVNSQILNIINDIEELNEETSTINGNIETINSDIEGLGNSKQNKIQVTDTIQISQLKAQYIKMTLSGADLQTTLDGKQTKITDNDYLSISDVNSLQTTLDGKQTKITDNDYLTISDVNSLQTTLDGKQNILKAGTNISIDADTNTISASGSGGTTIDADTDITVANITCDNITARSNSTIQAPTITATNTLKIGTDNVSTLIGNKQDKLNSNSINITTGDITCKNIFSTLNQGNIISGSKIQASDINVNNQDVITLIGKKQNVITIIDNLIYIILCILFHLQSRLRQVQLEMERYKLPI